MSVQLLYFAWVRETLGTDGERIDLPGEVGTVAALLDWLATRSDRHAAALKDRGRIRVAVDQQFAHADTPLAGASEIAIFPPVTGG